MGPDSYLCRVARPNGFILDPDRRPAALDQLRPTSTNRHGNPGLQGAGGLDGARHLRPDPETRTSCTWAPSPLPQPRRRDGLRLCRRPSTNYGDSAATTRPAPSATPTHLRGEGAFIHNNFSVQGEYADIKVNRLNTVAAGADPDVKVGYAYVSFWPTGETRNYDAPRASSPS